MNFLLNPVPSAVTVGLIITVIAFFTFRERANNENLLHALPNLSIGIGVLGSLMIIFSSLNKGVIYGFTPIEVLQNFATAFVPSIVGVLGSLILMFLVKEHIYHKSQETELLAKHPNEMTQELIEKVNELTIKQQKFQETIEEQLTVLKTLKKEDNQDSQ